MGGIQILLRDTTPISQIYDQGLDIEIWGAGIHGDYLYMYYNVVSNCENGIGMYMQGDAITTWDNIHIDNNTVYNSGGTWGHAQRQDAVKGNGFWWALTTMLMTNSTFKNNIIHTASGKLFFIENGNPVAGLTSDYNLFYPDAAAAFTYGGSSTNFADYKTASSKDAHSLNSDPLFVSAATGDFRLKGNSPAKNAGVDVSLTTDYAGKTVPFGAAPDMGAYEWYPSGGVLSPFLGLRK